MPEYDDETLERIMREGLEARAREARNRLDDAPGARPARGRRTPWLVAVAATVVVAGGATYALLHDAGPDSGQVAVDPGEVPSSWRFEAFDGVQLRVPPDWGWGGAPMGTGADASSCGTTTALVPQIDGAAMQDSVPFVGRPAMMSDACQLGGGSQTWPHAFAVWLGSPLPVGTDSSGDQVAETIAIGGQHVTAFGDDAALRAKILSTAETVEVDGNGCPTDPVRESAPGPSGDRTSESLSVCVYDAGRLLWSGRAGSAPAQDYVTAFEQASATYDPKTLCTGDPGEQYVAIGVHFAGRSTVRWDLADFTCPALVGRYAYGNEGRQSPIEAPFVAQTVTPWALGGIKAYVAGPADPSDEVASYFRGYLG